MVRAAALIAAAMLTGCGPSPCSPIMSEADAQRLFLKETPGETPSTLRINRQNYAEYCVQKWGYTLGAQGGSSEQITADAVMGACQEPIHALVSAQMYETLDRDSKFAGMIDTGLSWLTGVSVKNEVADQERFHQLALFAVVQGRAGHCLVPVH